MDLNNVAVVLFRLLAICTFAAVSGVFTAKAFYCRDPDTGKLYPVNSTWPSLTFCGRYNCKLRKKTHGNLSLVTPPLSGDNNKQAFADEDHLSENCTQPKGIIVEDKVKSDFEKMLDSDKETFVNLENFKKLDNINNVEIATTTREGDRYLTEEEITALSLLLQTMKKSDLEAILEVYNLAQDIYKEIDKVTEEKLSNITQDDKEMAKEKKPIQNEIPDERKNKKVSYWYEPLTAVNSKIKAAEVVETSQGQQYMHQIPITVISTAKPKSLYEGLNLIEESKNKQQFFNPFPKNKINEKSFIKGPLMSSDFRKLPYYHPLTNFQKQASYVRPNEIHSQPNFLPTSYAQSAVYSPEILPQPGYYPTEYYKLQEYIPLPVYPQQQKDVQAYAHQTQEENLHTYSQHQNSVHDNRPHGKCCKKPVEEPPFRLIPWSKLVEDKEKAPYVNAYDERKSLYPGKTYDKGYSEKQHSMNLDLPLAYLQDYNLSSMNPYNADNSWNLVNLSGKYKRRRQPSYLGGAYEAQAPKGVIVNADVNSEVKAEEQEQVHNPKDVKLKLLDWQTEPLAISVLNDVKANIAQSKLLPYPFRKKVKIEQVGKLIKLDDTGRIKRDTKLNVHRRRQISTEEYEAYIEKSICETDTEPGFFRMGNSTEPFPACCPQRIRS